MFRTDHVQAHHGPCTHLTTTFVGSLTLCSLRSADNCKEQVVLAMPGPAAISLESLLHKQLQVVRNAEQQRTVEEIIYLWSLHNLAKGSMCIRTSLGTVEQPSSHQQVCNCHNVNKSRHILDKMPGHRPLLGVWQTCQALDLQHYFFSVNQSTSHSGTFLQTI